MQPDEEARKEIASIAAKLKAQALGLREKVGGIEDVKGMWPDGAWEKYNGARDALLLAYRYLDGLSKM